MSIFSSLFGIYFNLTKSHEAKLSNEFGSCRLSKSNWVIKKKFDLTYFDKLYRGTVEPLPKSFGIDNCSLSYTIDYYMLPYRIELKYSSKNMSDMSKLDELWSFLRSAILEDENKQEA